MTDTATPLYREDVEEADAAASRIARLCALAESMFGDMAPFVEESGRRNREADQLDALLDALQRDAAALSAALERIGVPARALPSRHGDGD